MSFTARAIYDKYPNEPGLEKMARKIADKFYEADVVLNGNYDYSFFDYSKMKPMKNTICAQPDAAAGHAWVLYSAYKKFGDPKYLKGAKSALAALESQTIKDQCLLYLLFYSTYYWIKQ